MRQPKAYICMDYDKMSKKTGIEFDDDYTIEDFFLYEAGLVRTIKANNRGSVAAASTFTSDMMAYVESITDIGTEGEEQEAV